MRFGIGARLGAVAAILVASAGIGGFAPAAACGGVFTGAAAGSAATVHREAALASWDGHRETLIMQLTLRTGADNAALIVPTPTPATVGAAAPDTFTELAARTAPQVRTSYRWFAEVDGETGAPKSGVPAVRDRVRLGPIEAATLSGGDLTGIRKWLGDNGYQITPQVADRMTSYLRDGWSFVALRLTSDRPLSGAVDPVRIVFDTDRLIYPMRMSAAATAPQTVELFLLGAHRMQRSDPDAGKHRQTLEFADRITDPTDPDLRALSAGGRDYLTALQIAIDIPGTITTDLTFTDAPTDTPFRSRVDRVENADILGMPGGIILFAAFGAVGLFALIFVFVPNRPRRGDYWAA
ncbi:DUF2330 domain-containing protein [Nocardia panacis]|uniref:DUF2330 domain-containing protein n=1 Tax=Nocardia panacis TaxID=2340916 RepID=A0A3A4KDU0_9NOCA|nr:DUF2330 domain-containing protein [Nocardia panacis]RJO78729.1 DUF2330 domain-containing protein [Nocardia panacis]